MDMREAITQHLTELGFCPHTPSCGSFAVCVETTYLDYWGTLQPLYKQISVLVPTRGRVARLRKLYESYASTTQHCAELVFRVDEDDVETQRFLKERVCKMVVGPRLQGYRSLPIFFNEMLTVASGHVLLCGNDDMVFKTPGWDRLILNEANKYPDGLFDFGVHTHNEDNFPFAIVSRRAVQRLGFIFDPQIFWGDIYLRDVMAHFGRSIKLSNVNIDHDWAGHQPDHVFIEGDQVRRSHWMGNHPQAVREAVEKLKELL